MTLRLRVMVELAAEGERPVLSLRLGTVGFSGLSVRDEERVSFSVASALPLYLLEPAAVAIAGLFVRAPKGFGMTLNGDVGAAFRGDILTLSAVLSFVYSLSTRSSSVSVRRFGSIIMSCFWAGLVTVFLLGDDVTFLLGDAAAFLLGDEVAFLLGDGMAFLLGEEGAFALFVFLGLAT
jgi:hypothetical protein